MTREELKHLKVGDRLVYTDLDKGIDHEIVEVHPWHRHLDNYVWVTKHVEPVHYSALEKYAES